MAYSPVAKFDLGRNLSDLNQLFNEHGITHRFTEEGEFQVLWVDEQHSHESYSAILQGFLSGDRPAVTPPSPAKNGSPVLAGLLFWSKRAPVTFIVIALGVLGYFLALNRTENSPLLWLIFQPFSMMSETGQWWRLLTPAILHFGIFHVLFNTLWIWDIGRKLEANIPKINYVALLLMTAITGNVIEYLVSKHVFFGGLSGVVFGLFGYVGVVTFFYQKPFLRVPKVFFAFIGLYLLLGFTGIFTLLFGIQIANWAHLGGALAGVFCGFLFRPTTQRG